MQIKVCGMREPENIKALDKLPVDMVGFIFYPKSPRFIGEKLGQWLEKQAGLLEVKEYTWTGWRAAVDGTGSPLSGDTWLTVEVPAGEHEIAFRFRPWDATLGIVLMLAGILLCVLTWRIKTDPQDGSEIETTPDSDDVLNDIPI